MTKRALIFGALGQDGGYLGRLRPHTLKTFLAAAFADSGLDTHEHVDIDRSLFRPGDIAYSRGNPDEAQRELGWQANTRLPELVRRLVAADAA